MSALIKYSNNVKHTRLPQITKDVGQDPRLLQLKPGRLPPLPRVRDLLHIYGIKAKKQMSQNFLLNQSLLKKIVRAAGVVPGQRVVEIGPGPGNLTRAILERSPFEVLAVEKDRRFLPILEQLTDSVLPGQLKILLGDALDHDLDNIFGDPQALMKQFDLPEGLPDYLFNFSREWEDPKYPMIRVLGNLPFSVSTPLLIKWLHLISERRGLWKYGRTPMLLMFQEEVARRICAEPASAERSRLSAMAQNYCHVDYKFKITGSTFMPTAQVDTGVVRFHPLIKPHCKAPFKLFERFVLHLFHHRNHDLNYNYKTLFPRTMHDQAFECFRRARVNHRIYPYMISNRELARLCDEYHELCKDTPALVHYNYRARKKLLTEQEMEFLEAQNLLEDSPLNKQLDSS